MNNAGFGAAGLGQSGFGSHSGHQSAPGFSPGPSGQPGGFGGLYENYNLAHKQYQPTFLSDSASGFGNSGPGWDAFAGKNAQTLNANVAPWDATQSANFLYKPSSVERSLSRNQGPSPSWQSVDAASFKSFAHAPSWDPSVASYVQSVQNTRPASRGPPRSVASAAKKKFNLSKGSIYESGGVKVEIRDVWQDNLEDEFRIIRRLIKKYNYVAMDTEFPGVVARPTGPFSENDYNYQTLRCNVDILNLIQLGISFADSKGNLAKRSDAFPNPRSEEDDVKVCCWQFHFKFNLQEDLFAQDSIDLLKRSGIDFDQHEEHGIVVEDFGELLTSSGLVLTPDVHWIAFHGSYDFAYMIKVLTCIPLPKREDEFFKLLDMFFPHLYDIKHITSVNDIFSGGLNRLAEIVDAKRIGQEHQAGSDSLLTLAVFFKVKEKHFIDNEEELRETKGVLHGIGYRGSMSTPQMMSPTMRGIKAGSIEALPLLA